VNTPHPPLPNRPARKSGVVIPRQPAWHGRLASFTLWALATALAKTWRVDARDESGLIHDRNADPAIFALWHNRLGIAMEFWRWGQIWQPEARLAALISASRDGALLASTFARFNVIPIRGSSSRRGPQALIELTRALRQGCHVAITPDGPRGPKYIVQPGVISLAQLSGCPIIPVGAKISGKLRLRSWDQFQIPLPFSRCELLYGHAFQVPRDAPEAAREQLRLALQTELLRMNPD
jgi:lysophospholipid acyltransferase (LPLAT)-like uncharacterized protein